MNRLVYILITFALLSRGESVFAASQGSCPFGAPCGGGNPFALPDASSTDLPGKFTETMSGQAKQLGALNDQRQKHIDRIKAIDEKDMPAAKKAATEARKAADAAKAAGKPNSALDTAATTAEGEVKKLENERKAEEAAQKIAEGDMANIANKMLDNAAGKQQLTSGSGSGGGGSSGGAMPPPPGGGGGGGKEGGGDSGGNNPSQTAQNNTPQPSPAAVAQNTQKEKEPEVLQSLQVPRETQVASTTAPDTAAADAAAAAKAQAKLEAQQKETRQAMMMAQAEKPAATRTETSRTYEPTGGKSGGGSGGLGIDMSPREQVVSNSRSKASGNSGSNSGLGGALLGVAPKKASPQNRLLTAAVVPTNVGGSKGVAPNKLPTSTVQAAPIVRGVTGAKALQKLTMTEEAKRLLKLGKVPKALHSVLNSRIKIVRGSMADSRSKIVVPKTTARRDFDGAPHRVISSSVGGSHFE